MTAAIPPVNGHQDERDETRIVVSADEFARIEADLDKPPTVRPNLAAALSRAILPPVNGHQDADGPGVTWFDGRPWCSRCDTPLNAGTTVAGNWAPFRPTRVSTGPMCDGGAA